MKKVSYLFVLSLFVLIACNQNTTNNKTSEMTNSDMEHAHESNGEVTACQHASKIYWTGSKPTGEHSGIIKMKQGNYIVENEKLVGGTFIIDMNSIINIDIEDEEKNAKLVNHLKGEDFFHVDSFPEANFVISEVAESSNADFSHLIKGELTIKGISSPISFHANIKVGNGVVSATSEEFSIDRTTFKVNYKSKSIFGDLKDKFIDDEIRIKIEAYSM